jgi:nicotinate-nucleotide pyrophosphorylase (carboxylating)
VAALAGTRARLVDTRKTTPGLRSLEKYAVRCGGGSNHRFGLSDGVLIKDNHIAILRRQGVPLREAVARARAHAPHSLRVEVEVDQVDQIEEALAGGADVILLDNMPPAVLAEAVRRVAGRASTEASGGITLDNVRAVAETGVDLISVGALTHSVRALDLALDVA